MTFDSFSPVRAGTWVAVDNDSRFVCRVDDADSAELVVYGPVEMAVGMSEAKIRECMTVLGDALEEMRHAGQQAEQPD